MATASGLVSGGTGTLALGGMTQETTMEWLVNELAARAGITGRTLRHYDRIGLLSPSRIGTNGYRYYGPDAVARLQRILLMRRLGLGLPTIARVLDEEADELGALRAHIDDLEAERDLLDQRIHAVRHTLESRQAGIDPCMDVMLEGFNDRYRDEVVARWGEAAFQAANDWWHDKTLEQQRAWKRATDELVAAWIDLWRDGVAATAERAQSQAARHVAWLTEIPGTPTAEGDRERSIQMVCGLADMYVDDPRFAATYDGAAAFVRDVLHEYAKTRM
ncbi:MerR family transcriptional regulator [Nocardia arthritidis]|uniref:MerR family transcriptional regulator n=1 Tax=Nocardia arthritidis TaxID=228602 RepID=A0A6G9YGA5_9NOCA|nr:MerR family transcriptional regulator [Nocardia arthritidis]QIS12170.1 MerR family transcriptional regulator [Nocardia arthritidis]